MTIGDQPFEYPPGVDRDAFDAQTYLEGGTAEADAAARRIDSRTSLRTLRFQEAFERAGHSRVRSCTLALKAEELCQQTSRSDEGYSLRAVAELVIAYVGRHPQCTWEEIAHGVREEVYKSGQFSESVWRVCPECPFCGRPDTGVRSDGSLVNHRAADRSEYRGCVMSGEPLAWAQESADLRAAIATHAHP